ncbi:uncharacterized protein LOC128212063 [Mya arenaria]|uniref:uncharacterized protein LOC128212063 n=2 Tax=Mya arenaria TaxID=6604 RepID=UPI0022E1DC4C|nr:uncharacterized protein LOC128212063 [Mya arenaria]XP_052773269.1 uncharacterized protein LOC128212063 [Mya arenaria]XP_052773270.1 uncharacterized protein LOC128212063 [Mya arenaria]
MLKPYFNNRKSGPPLNMENLFVHRVDDGEFPAELRSRTPNTFWRSPYTGDTGSQVNKSVCLKPMLTITTPLKRPKIDNGGHVKSILKNKPGDESFEDNTKDESKPVRPLSEPQTPKLITTGTGQVMPHGAGPVRSKTAGKRVQFSSVTVKETKRDITSSPVSTNNLHTSTIIPFKGRRLFLDKNISTRILGTPARTATKWQKRGESVTGFSLSGGEANIKSQINAFIRKLKLAECERAAKSFDDSSRTIVIEDETSQRKTADKLRRLRSCPEVPMRPDWSEYDIDRTPTVKTKLTSSEVSDKKSRNNVDDDQSDSLSESVSIESFESPKEDKVVEKTPSGAKIFRPKPMASLYTKYRHITTNELNKYGNSSAGKSRNYYRLSSLGRNSTNFCDTRKTDQILGWLEEVRTANTAEEDAGTKGSNDR